MKDNERQPLAERSILALMIHDESARKLALSQGITQDHFTEGRPVFAAIEDLFRDGEHVDAATVASRIDLATVDDVSVHELVAKLDAQEPDPSGWPSWVKTIRRAYASRIAADASAFALGESDPEMQADALEGALEAIKAALSGPSGAIDAKTACAAFFASMQDIAESGRAVGIPTGIPELDAISGGMRPGELWACMGQTSAGKTVLMNQIATGIALTGRKTAFFSCEMMVDELIARTVADVGNTNLTTVLQPLNWKEKDAFGTAHMAKIKSAIEKLAACRAWFDDTPRMTMRHIENECQRLADQNDGLDLIVVDYMQIITPESTRRESREQEVARVSGALKQLAKKMKCPVLSASQLNDDGKVRESRAIAFDANVLLGIEEIGIRIVKMRNGARDKPDGEPSLKYTLNGALQRFEP